VKPADTVKAEYRLKSHKKLSVLFYSKKVLVDWVSFGKVLLH